VNEIIYNIAVWMDGFEWSTSLHESYYMYNWIESTHVLTLMVSLGMLFMIDLRMLGAAFPNVPATTLAHRLNLPMWIGFSAMIITGVLLVYAIPVRTSQSLWFRFKMVLLVCAAVNAYLLHKRMSESGASWENDAKAPKKIRISAALSLGFWTLIVISGRFIAYDWFDCEYGQSAVISFVAGCVDGQTQW
jgi:hypothetical protein